MKKAKLLIFFKFDGDNFRYFKVVCPKCRRVNIFFCMRLRVGVAVFGIVQV